MNRELIEGILMFILSMTGLACTTKVFLTFINRRRAPNEGELEAMRESLSRIEQAVETTAIEVERIAEAQRFTSKLLAERGTAEPRPANAPHRVITPH